MFQNVLKTCQLLMFHRRAAFLKISPTAKQRFLMNLLKLINGSPTPIPAGKSSLGSCLHASNGKRIFFKFVYGGLMFFLFSLLRPETKKTKQIAMFLITCVVNSNFELQWLCSRL